MIEVRVQVIVNQKTKGFKLYEKGLWSKSEDYEGNTIYDIISEVNKKYNITTIFNEDIGEEVAYYEAIVDDIEYIVDMG